MISKITGYILYLEAKEGPILEKCVLSMLLISMGSVFTVFPVSS